MKAQEKKLLGLLGALFALVLIVRVVPWLGGFYTAGQQEIEVQQQRIERYRNLIEDTGQWQEREALKRAETEDYRNWVFAGDSLNQVGVSVQRALRQAAERTGITVRETPVASYSRVDDWLLVRQDMNFTLNQSNILPFLRELDAQQPRLYVESFRITRSRRQYNGSITVVGFSPAGS